MINRFREEVKSVARKVASDKGLSIVVTKNDSVIFAYDSTVDITNEVADQLLLAAPKSGGKPAATTAAKPTESKKR